MDKKLALTGKWSIPNKKQYEYKEAANLPKNPHRTFCSRLVIFENLVNLVALISSL